VGRGVLIITSNKEKYLLYKIGKNIHARRKKLAISQEELAKSCCINRSYLSEIEHGTRNTTLLTIYRISIALDTSIEQLLQ